MKTEKWYWSDPFLFEGEAKIIEVTKWKDTSALILDRSLFYPEGGGQKGDRGEIILNNETVKVIDTQIDEAGQIHLLLERALPVVAAGSMIVCRINEDWRRRQMSQHTGQHMLSRLLHDTYHAPTVSARLGETSLSLEIDSATIAWDALVQAETTLNALILEDRSIRSWFPTPEELSALDLRKQPSVTEGIRVVQVEGFDVTPCGGTHCTRIGQVGVVHIQSMERYKGMTRLFVSVGLDAARDFQRKEQTLQSIQTLVDANAESVLSQVQALQANYRKTQEEKERYMLRAAEAEAARYTQTNTGPVTSVVLGDVSPEYARLVSKQLVQAAPAIVIVSCLVDGGTLVVLDRGINVTADIGATLKPILARHSGKGGGSATHAEARIPLDSSQSFLEELSATFAATE